MKKNQVVYGLQAIFFSFMIIVTFSCSKEREFRIEDVKFEPYNNSEVIITVISDIERIELTKAQIESLGMKRLTTVSFWVEGDSVFEGVLLSDLLFYAGLDNYDSIKITALDNYSITIPQIDWKEMPVLLATRAGEEPITVMEKGPTRIIYPRNSKEEMSDIESREKWIWAIKKIEGIR